MYLSFNQPPVKPGSASGSDEAPCRCAGSFDRFLNVQISFIILLQIAMCAVHGSLSLWWRNKYGIEHYYLALDVQGQVRRPHTQHRHCLKGWTAINTFVTSRAGVELVVFIGSCGQNVIISTEPLACARAGMHLVPVPQ